MEPRQEDVEDPAGPGTKMAVSSTVFREGQPIPQDYTGEGAEFPLEISLSPLRVGDQLLVIAVIRDVTERRAADEELQRAREELALVDDRERIARDLHDTVIQRLFAVGLSLQGALTRATGDPAIERIQLAIDEIDVTIRDIRSSIFALHTRRAFAASLRDDVLVIAREAARALGFEPSVMFDGPVDSVVTDEIVNTSWLPCVRHSAT